MGLTTINVWAGLTTPTATPPRTPLVAVAGQPYMATATAQSGWTEVTESDIPNDWHAQLRQCFQSDTTGQLLAIEAGTAHGSRYSVNVLNAPFYEDPHVLETVGDTDDLSEAEGLAETYMQENE